MAADSLKGLRPETLAVAFGYDPAEALGAVKPPVYLTSTFIYPNAQHAKEQGGYATVLPCITMKTATGEILMGWLASQTDMLAEDWGIVGERAAQPTMDYEAEVDKMLAQINVAYTQDECSAFLTAMMKGIVTAGTYAENKEAAQALAVLLSNKVRESIPKAFELTHG